MDISLSLALFVILLFGVPHGAFDIIFLKTVAKNSSKTHWVWVTLLLMLVYIMIIIAVVICWYAQPLPMMLIFLCLSTIHFGDVVSVHGMHNKMARLSCITYGGLVTIFLPLLHWRQVEPIFNSLLFGQLAHFEWCLNIAFIVWIMCFARYLKYAWKSMPLHEHVVLIATIFLFIIMPPLLAFVIYFCGYHSPKHFIYMFKRNPNLMREEGLLCLAILCLTWVTAFLVYFNLVQVMSVFNSSAYLLFIGLFALTVPHMILVDGIYSRSKQSFLGQPT